MQIGKIDSILNFVEFQNDISSFEKEICKHFKEIYQLVVERRCFEEKINYDVLSIGFYLIKRVNSPSLVIEEGSIQSIKEVMYFLQKTNQKGIDCKQNNLDVTQNLKLSQHQKQKKSINKEVGFTYLNQKAIVVDIPKLQLKKKKKEKIKIEKKIINFSYILNKYRMIKTSVEEKIMIKLIKSLKPLNYQSKQHILCKKFNFL